MNRGILYGIGCYVIWGLLPLYWKALQEVPAVEILANRVVWSLIFVVGLLILRQNWRWLRPALHQRRILLTFAATATLLAVNWFTYIWAVNAGYIIETSLGYFINPLVNVLLGVLFLREQLRRGQVAALSLAVLGVAYLTFSYGAFPWIALTLAFTFAFYGLLRKTAPLAAAEGLALETAVLFLPAVFYMLLLFRTGTASFAQGNLQTTLLLIGVGVVTAIPMLLFAAAARRITLTNIGLLQYIAPTMQFLLGVYVFNEAFGKEQLMGFGLIWMALLVYSAEAVWVGRGKHLSPAIKEPGRT
ncbi:MAG: EamA family transporter RarD [Anaerolineaceae bacterium]|nr:MAG: EamA family transporter RarD [Anaerolineaceae bacterium]